MTQSRMLEIRQLIEACQYTDNSAVEVEKTAVIVELLAQRTLEDAAEHGAMTPEEIDGLLKFYDEANESLVECEKPRGIANRSGGLTEGNIKDMTRERINQINGYLEGFYATDNGEAAWEKTALIEELLAEVEQLERSEQSKQQQE